MVTIPSNATSYPDASGAPISHMTFLTGIENQKSTKEIFFQDLLFLTLYYENFQIYSKETVGDIEKNGK